MSERRLNGHAEIGTRVRIITEDEDEYGHLFNIGDEGVITGFQWGYALVKVESHGYDQALRPSDYEVIDA